MVIAFLFKMVKAEYVNGSTKSQNTLIMNPYDMLAFQRLLALKKKTALEIIGITMGPKSSEDYLKRYMAIGIDNLYLISDPNFSGSDTFATSYILSKAIQKIHADFVVCGEKSVDGETGQVPIALAKWLGFSYVKNVDEIVGVASDTITIESQTAVAIETVRAPMPIVAIFRDFTLEEPIVGLFQLKSYASKKPVILDMEALNLDAADCGQRGSKTKVINVVDNLDKKESYFWTGTTTENAERIAKLLKE